MALPSHSYWQRTVPSAVQPNVHSLTMDAAKALQELQCVAVLSDLGEWLLWETRYEAALGPLKDFVQQHGECLLPL